VLGPITYKLQLPEEWKIHLVSHANLLTLFKETEEYGLAYAEPPPEIIDDKEEYELEEVLASKHTPQEKLVYCVH
jgi:hypothetical protein